VADPRPPLVAGALVVLAAAALPTLAATTEAGAAALVTDPTSLVDPFIGTGANSDFSAGNTFPGADVPHGMLQWSPDTTSRPSGGGYDYAGSDITGFSLTHVSGPGCAAAGDVGFLPVTGALGSDPGPDAESFSHSDESASPGYYSVSLGNGTGVALTTTTHAGTGQFSFPATTSASVLLKLDGTENPYVSSTLDVVGDDELTGSVTSSGFCEATNDFTLYFAVDFDQPFTATGTYDRTSAGPGGAYATFDTTEDQTVTARVGISVQRHRGPAMGSESFGRAGQPGLRAVPDRPERRCDRQHPARDRRLYRGRRPALGPAHRVSRWRG
jgi:putative alpha-1,2-mannosidase